MGCGSSGVNESPAHVKRNEGHDVVVVDYDQHALDRLGEKFKGTKIKGVGFDRDTLDQSGH